MMHKLVKNGVTFQIFVALVLVAALSLLPGLLPANEVLAAEIVASGTCGAEGDNLTWTLDSEGLLTISGTGAMADYEVLGSTPWYRYCTSILSVEIGDGVTSIGWNAFLDCTNLTSVIIPSTVITFRSSPAFSNCPKLTSAGPIGSGSNIEFGWTDAIPSFAFSGCSSLTSVTIPNSVTSIGESVFSGCSSLTSIVIPASVTSIGRHAFYDCGLTEVIIPESVTSIGGGAFNCPNLNSVSVDENNSYYSSQEGVLFNKNKTKLIYMPHGKSGAYLVPNTVVSIEGGAFYDCDNLTSVTIPNDVISIKEQAFCDCDNLTSVAIPNGLISIGNAAFFSCSNLTSIALPDSITSIGLQAFYGCISLTNINIPTNLSTIGYNVFGACTSLTSVTIPESVTSIGFYAFSDCTGLTSVTIPDSVISIFDGAFRNCSGLTSMTISDSVINIGETAFSGCSSLTGITVDSNNESYSSLDGALFNKDKTVLICVPGGKSGDYIIPNSTIIISNNAFCYCNKLTSVSIPAGITHVDEYVFEGCDSLASINVDTDNEVYSTQNGVLLNKEGNELLLCPLGKKGAFEIPDGVIRIGNNAFENCEKLTSVTICDGVINIGECAFSGCNSLANITIPDSVTSIENEAFWGCGNLNSVIIPKSVINIGDGVFRDCENLTDIYYRGSEKEWGKIQIGNYNSYLFNATIHYNYNDNNLCATAATASFAEYDYSGAGGNWSIFVPFNSSVTLTVLPSADEEDGITFKWKEYIRDEDDEYSWEAHYLEEYSDNLLVEAVDEYKWYGCEVEDKYGNSVTVEFYIYIDSNLSAEVDVNPFVDKDYRYDGGSNYVDVYVPLSQSVKLKVRALADEGSIITYQWYREVYDETEDCYYIERIDDATGEEYTIDSVTEASGYHCEIKDQYNNNKTLWFAVHIDNGFSAVPNTTIFKEAGYTFDGGSNWVNVYVPFEQAVILSVDASVNDGTEITYEWWHNNKMIDGAITDTLSVDQVTENSEYFCEVKGEYGNSATVRFYIHIDNGFSVTVDTSPFIDAGYKYVLYGDCRDLAVYVPFNDSVTLKVNATANDPNGITYEWSGSDDEPISNTTDTLVIENTTKSNCYSCKVCDSYGNIYYAFYIVNAVAENYSVEAVGDTSLVLDFGATTDLQVKVTAADMNGITYKWWRNDYHDYYDAYNGETVYYDNDSDTLTIEPLTTHRDYICLVSDQYGNSDYVSFDIQVNNGLSATVFGTDSTFVEMEVPLGGSASMKVDADATDDSGIRYKWYSVNPIKDENGNPIPVATGSDLVLIDGSGLNDTLNVSNVKESKWYFSRVLDKFSNMVEVFFHLIVPNELTVTPEQTDITVPSNSSQTLTVTASALDMEGITYQWTKFVYNNQGERFGEERLLCTDASIQVDNITRHTVYRCTVTDKYGNYANSTFNISLTELEGHTVTLDDYTKGAAVITGIQDGGSYSGETPFTVTCDKACVVAYTTDDGESYTVLTNTGSGSTRSFTLTVSEDTEVFIALVGDVDLSGDVTRKDATLLSRFMARWKGVEVNPLTADIDASGAVARKDATLLSRRIAKWTSVKDYFEW